MDCVTQIPTLLSWPSLLSGLITGVVLGLLAHFWAIRRDKSNDEKKLQREMFGLLNAVSFALLTQYSELYNLKQNLQHRLTILNDNVVQHRNNSVQALQDFVTDPSLMIKFEHISELLSLSTTCFPNYRVNPAIFQACHISNKKYLDMITTLHKYSDMKRSISNDKDLFEALNAFLKTNIPSYLEMLEVYMPFIKKTQESLAELFGLLGKKPFQIDGSIKLWGAN